LGALDANQRSQKYILLNRRKPLQRKLKVFSEEIAILICFDSAYYSLYFANILGLMSFYECNIEDLCCVTSNTRLSLMIIFSNKSNEKENYGSFHKSKEIIANELPLKRCVCYQDKWLLSRQMAAIKSLAAIYCLLV
jgi:hypothetical protein